MARPSVNQSLHSLLRAVGLSVPSGLPNSLVKGLTFDSRCVEPGDLFVGLPGNKVDGGDFWAQALSAGAVAAVISPEAAKSMPPDSASSVVVVLEPLEQWAGELAAVFWHKPSSKLDLIGVTGTNGKTTTTHLIEHLSTFAGKPSALFGTLVNRWPGHSAFATHTTPFADSLQSQLAQAVVSGAQLGAMEVSSHALAQHRVAGCRFAGTIFTNLTQDHLDYHSSMEEYYEVKRSLFREPLFGCANAKAVVNIDDPWGQRLAEELGECCWRSSLVEDSVNNNNAELTITQIEMCSSGVRGVLQTPLGEGRFLSPLIGRFNLMNLLQAVGALLQQGLSLPDLLAGISDFPGVPGRMERVRLHDEKNVSSLPTVLVDYAHTPDGLKNALRASRSFAKGNLVCVFGCGGDRDRGKRPLMGAVASNLADQLVLTSDNPRTEDPQQIIDDVLVGMPTHLDMIVELDRSLAIEVAINKALADDVVLIAGKGHEDYQIIGSKKIHLDDREQAEKALRQKLMNR